MSEAPPYHLLPEHLRGGVRRWLEEGIAPGSFLRAVIANNLIHAVTRADVVSEPQLSDIVRWFIRFAPEGSFGNSAALADWPLYLSALERQAAQAAWEKSQ